MQVAVRLKNSLTKRGRPLFCWGFRGTGAFLNFGQRSVGRGLFRNWNLAGKSLRLAVSDLRLVSVGTDLNYSAKAEGY